MAFITATDSIGGITRHISAEHVMEVRSESDGSVITMALAGQQGTFRYHVVEPVQDIVGRIETALAYRRLA